MFEVVFYQKTNGTEPMKQHLDGLPLKLRAKVLRNLQILQEKGNELRAPETKFIGEGLFELRTVFSGDIERAFFFFVDGKKIIVTNGFVKKTQKTPQKEIERAKEYMQDYCRRKGK